MYIYLLQTVHTLVPLILITKKKLGFLFRAESLASTIEWRRWGVDRGGGGSRRSGHHEPGVERQVIRTLFVPEHNFPDVSER
jgi:hypothetical protein